MTDDISNLDEAMVAQVAQLYQRYLRAGSEAQAPSTTRGMWFGMAHGFRESARSLARAVSSQRRLREYRRQVAVATR